MDLGLSGKVVIVTGGGAGIGAAVTAVLAEEGAIPIVVGRSPVDETFRAGVEARQPLSIFIRSDLVDDASCAQVVAEATSIGAGVYGLVNNAGTNDGVGLDNGMATFQRSVSANLGHYFGMAHHALRHLRASRGAIVNISSKTALTGQGNTSGYVAAKAAQLGLTREWAAALAPDGIRVNAVLPAEVMTPMYASWLGTLPDPDAARARIEAAIPLERRMTTDREIADTVVFLLSRRASHTTGQWIVPDGGYTHLDRALTQR